MAELPEEDKLSRTDVTPGDKVSRKRDDLLYDAVCEDPANEESLADEDENLSELPQKG